MLFSSRIRVKVSVRIRFGVWLVSGYAHACHCHSLFVYVSKERKGGAHFRAVCASLSRTRRARFEPGTRCAVVPARRRRTSSRRRRASTRPLRATERYRGTRRFCGRYRTAPWTARGFRSTNSSATWTTLRGSTRTISCCFSTTACSPRPAILYPTTSGRSSVINLLLMRLECVAKCRRCDNRWKIKVHHFISSTNCNCSGTLRQRYRAGVSL